MAKIRHSITFFIPAEEPPPPPGGGGEASTGFLDFLMALGTSASAGLVSTPGGPANVGFLDIFLNISKAGPPPPGDQVKAVWKERECAVATWDVRDPGT